MKISAGLAVALLLAVSGFAQSRGGFFNPQPTMQGGFGNVVFPGGTSQVLSGVTRSFGSVTFPGGGGPRLNVPLTNQDPTWLSSTFGRPPASGFNRHRQRSSSIGAVPYVVPVYVGDYSGYYNGYYDNGVPPAPPVAAPAPAQQPNVIVIYANSPQPVTVDRPDLAAIPQPQFAEPAEESSTAPHYLIAFKDRTIYSAVAYWVEGETLHYFTSGNTHNQVSLSLVDVPLTDRLNRESGMPMQLPRR